METQNTWTTINTTNGNVRIQLDTPDDVRLDCNNVNGRAIVTLTATKDVGPIEDYKPVTITKEKETV